MPRYIIERHFGVMDESALDDPEWTKRRDAAFAQFPEIVWEHSHMTMQDDGFVTYCIYQAPDAQYVKDHAAAAGVPADRVIECWDRRPG